MQTFEQRVSAYNKRAHRKSMNAALRAGKDEVASEHFSFRFTNPEADMGGKMLKKILKAGARIEQVEFS